MVYVIFMVLSAVLIELIIPPMDMQRQFVAFVNQSDKSKFAWLKSQFIEMFGDYESNPYNLRKSTLGDECFYIKDGPHKSPKYIEDTNGIPFISTRNVVNGPGIDWSTAKYISEEDYLKCIKKCHPEKGDILYSKGGTTGIARVVDTDRKFANWVHVAVLKFGDQLDGKFLECMLNTDFCYEQSQRLTKGIVNRDFVLSAIAQVKIFVPPMDMQIRYCEFVQQSDKSKFFQSVLPFRTVCINRSLLQPLFFSHFSYRYKVNPRVHFFLLSIP